MRKKSKIKKYHDNGGVKMKYTKVDGKLHGVRELFGMDGTLWLRENYKEGELHGVREWFDENGTIRSRCDFKEGKLHGVQDGLRQEL